jgi:signal transduction histidine kinase
MAEMGRLEAIVGSSQERAAEIRTQITVLRMVSRSLSHVASLQPIDSDNSAALIYLKAARQMNAMVLADHDATVQRVMTGPLQRLTEAAETLELAGKVVGGMGFRNNVKRATLELHAASAELDSLIDDLRPALALHGLPAVLRDCVLRSAGDIGRVEIVGKPEEYAVALQRTLVRIAQDAVDNAVRHSHCDHIDVVLSMHPRRVLLVVRDDGDGFDVAATEARLSRTDCNGLLQMRQRAELEGGTLTVRSVPYGGCEVRAAFPLRSQDSV